MPETVHPIKPRVLVTEDDPENQKFFELLLRRNFEVEICDSAESFYNHLNKSYFDVILMDISLKGKKNGLELTKEIRQNEKFADIPIVCLTAHAFKDDKENAINAGVDIFLTKPIENHKLINTLLEFSSKRGK
jgi:CheY-like chemotaxis protein